MLQIVKTLDISQEYPKNESEVEYAIAVDTRQQQFNNGLLQVKHNTTFYQLYKFYNTFLHLLDTQVIW
jgi:hypothetical protein